MIFPYYRGAFTATHELAQNVYGLYPQEGCSVMEPLSMETALLQAAQKIYRDHVQLRTDVAEQIPRGVVIHPQTLRGDLIFSDIPILLPYEKFIPVDMLEVQG